MALSVFDKMLTFFSRKRGSTLLTKIWVQRTKQMSFKDRHASRLTFFFCNLRIVIYPFTPSWSQILSKIFLNNFRLLLTCILLRIYSFFRKGIKTTFNSIRFKSYNSLKNVRWFGCISATCCDKPYRTTEQLSTFLHDHWFHVYFIDK